MTYITKPTIEDSQILNEVARDLLIVDAGVTKLIKRFKVLTEDGVVHELSFNQLDGLINILDPNRSTAKITPLQYLVNHYGINDLIELGRQEWYVASYSIAVLADPKTVRFDGVMSKAGEVNKIFSFALGGFDFIQQLSLAKCIAAQHDDFSVIIGTYDVSYLYHFGDGKHSVTTDLGEFNEK